ncbi:glycosyltransferase family 4 protein, partial [Candidatus Woesearchaeota archaeon]|nr:glycosyltransferase family 4 protein [Candidatus Woesearchaeota archaeon]
LFMDRTIAVSEDVKKFLTKYEGVNPSKITIVHPGIDTKLFTKQKGIRQKLGLSKKDFVIGIVGRLSPEKGHDLLIKAISGLKKPCRLVVLGEGKLKPSLQVLAKKLNVRADFLGFRDDMPAIYSSLDVLCLPSYFEGLPLVLAEAMSSECIFICSDIPNNREVAQNAPAQLFFEKGNTAALRKAIQNVMINSDKYGTFIKKARNSMKKHFDVRESNKRVKEVYSKCAR